jgi:hypothetical protein
VHHSTGHSRAAHRTTVAGQDEPHRHASGPVARSILLNQAKDPSPGMTRNQAVGGSPAELLPQNCHTTVIDGRH